MVCYVLSLLLLTVHVHGGYHGDEDGVYGGDEDGVFGGDGLSVPHIHHGVERADIWGDVWVVNLRSGIDPQVHQSSSMCPNISPLIMR